MKRSMVLSVALLLFCGLAVFGVGTASAVEGGIGLQKIHPNVDNAETLAKAQGMTPELAKAMVEYRDSKGFFKKVEDLMNVPGVTKEIYEKMAPKVGAEGDIYLLPREGEKIEKDEDAAPPLSPSKC